MKVTMFKAESYVGYKLCWPGDLVINSLWAWGRGLGVSRVHGIISSAYGVYRVRNAEAIHPDFIHELVRSKPFHWELMVRSKGIWKSRLQLTDQAFLNAPIPLPPFDEQAAIVRFIGHMDRRIRRYIRAKRRLISLLNEQKHAIIHHAVTRGLDSNACLKPSGVKGVGSIPHDWNVLRGKYVFASVDVRSRSGSETLLTVSAKDGVVPREEREVTMFKAASYVGHKLCWPGDLVINSLWAWANGLGFSRHHGIVSTAYGVYRLREPFNGLEDYLHYLLRSKAYDWQFNVRSKGIWKSRLQLTDSAFLDMRVLIPSREEAASIVSWLNVELRDISSALEKAEREIALLSEYRTGLVSDVITGKLDVRDVASRLPDEIDERDGDASDLVDGEEFLEELEPDTEPEEAEA